MSENRRETSVALALGSSPWESEFVTALVACLHGAKVRRCVDIVDLAGYVDSACPDLIVVDDQFPRLDVSTIARIGKGNAVLVGVCATKEGADRLKNLGVTQVVPVDSGGVTQAATAVSKRRLTVANAQNMVDSDATRQRTTKEVTGSNNLVARSRVMAVWGPPGGPGRTHIAVTLAQQLAASGRAVMLADADTTCAGVGPSFCLTPEGSGLIAAAHHAERGTLDPAVLARLARAITDNLRVLTGLPHVSRRAELRAAPMSRVWEVAGRLTDDTVVDIGACLDDGSLALDGDVADFGLAAGGESAAVTALSVADELVAVTSCEPAAVARLISHVGAISGLAPAARLTVVVNRVRSPLVAGRAGEDELCDFLREQTGTDQVICVAEDRAGMDAAIAAGLTLFESNRKSRAVADISQVVEQLSPQPVSRRDAPVAIGA